MKNEKLKRALGVVVVGASVIGHSLVGAPLEESDVSREAKWLAHIDIETLMASSFGGYFAEQLKVAVKEHNDSPVSIDVDRVLEELRSVTAYGKSIDQGGEVDGVLIFKTGDKLPAIIDGLLAHESLVNEGEIPFEELDGKPFRTILFDGELYLSYPEEGLIMISKRFEDIEAAYSVMEGKAPTLRESKERLLLNPGQGFFLVATATGFDHFKDMPPQARILQKTTGGQVSLGEDAGMFKAQVMLATSEEAISQKVFHIVKGLVALASFATVEEEGMAGVVSRIEVAYSKKDVTINFQYPVDELMSLVGSLMQKHGGDNNHHHHQPQQSDEAKEGGDGASQEQSGQGSTTSRVAEEPSDLLSRGKSGGCSKDSRVHDA